MRLLGPLPVLAILCLLAGPASGEREPPAALPGEFVIGISAGQVVEPGDYALAAQAGFGYALAPRPDADCSLALLKGCEAAGMKAVVWDARIATYGLGDGNAYSAALAEYRKSSALGGYVIFSSLYVPVTRTGSLYWKQRDIGWSDQKHFRYCEAVPLSAFPDEKAYPAYLRSYLASVIGYVVYEETAPSSATALRAMKLTADVCGELGKPWWRRCRLADATPAMVRWQAFSAAAHGCRGIFYLTARALGDQRDTLLDDGGKPTAACAAATAANARLRAIGPILMNTKLTGVFASGSIPGLPAQDQQAAPRREGLLRPRIPGLPPVTASSPAPGDAFLIGRLEKGESVYAFVVRKPSDDDEPADRTSPSAVTVRAAGGGALAIAETGAACDGPVALRPGEGQLFEIK